MGYSDTIITPSLRSLYFSYSRALSTNADLDVTSPKFIRYVASAGTYSVKMPQEGMIVGDMWHIMNGGVMGGTGDYRFGIILTGSTPSYYLYPGQQARIRYGGNGWELVEGYSQLIYLDAAAAVGAPTGVTITQANYGTTRYFKVVNLPATTPTVQYVTWNWAPWRGSSANPMFNARVYWVPRSTGTGTSRFYLDLIGIGDNITLAQTVGFTAYVEDAVQTQNYMHVTPWSENIGGSVGLDGGISQVMLKRDIDDAGNSYDGQIHILGIDIAYDIDRGGW
jgi:hypothetical protein